MRVTEYVASSVTSSEPLPGLGESEGSGSGEIEVAGLGVEDGDRAFGVIGREGLRGAKVWVAGTREIEKWKRAE